MNYTMKLKSLFTLIFFSSLIFSQNLIWENEIDLIKTSSSVRSFDLNSDGTEDVVLSGGVDGYPTPFGTIAIDGLSGDILWTKDNQNEWFISAQSFDFNLDGTPDVIVGGRDAALKVINGLNGEEIWSFWNSEENPNDYGWYNFYNPQLIPDQNNDNLPEILCANGGDHSLDSSVSDRPPGHIMILDGYSGSILNNAVVPDSNETYMSPLYVDLDGDNNYNIIFGTGGETIQGNLWIADFNDLLTNDLSNSTSLLPNPELGMLAPPSIAKLNGDETYDIIAQNFDGKITAIDGEDFENIIWEVNIEGTESAASAIVGNFTNNDNNGDVFATLYVGGQSSYSDFYQVLIDGESGDIIYMDSIGSFNFATPICFDSNSNGKDEVLISTTNSVNGEFEHELILIDFINDTQTSIFSTIGGDIYSTPQIKDIDNNDYLDLIFVTQKDNPFIPSGVEIRRLETSYLNPPFGVSWGSYMGTNFDGIFDNSGECNTDLDLFAFPAVSCPGENSGSINLYIGPNSTGTPPYEYFWSNGETTEDLENLSVGSYSVTVVDANGCQDTITTNISEYESIYFSTPPTCPGGSDGMAYMSSTGCSCNSSNCQFIWTNEEGEIIAQGDGSTAEETYKYLFDIPAGIYTATIIHPNGCVLEEEIIVPETDLIGEAIIEHICPGSGLLGSITFYPESPNLISPYCVWENYPVFDGLTLANDLNPGSYTVSCQWDTDGNGIIEPIFDCFQTKTFEVLELELDCNQECNGATLDDCGNCDSNLENDCILGCIDSAACNFSNLATDDDGSCIYVDGICESCENGVIIDNDLDNDGICDNNEIVGCTDSAACNFNILATDDDGSCIYAEEFLDCNGNCLNDFDFDNVCDEYDNCPDVFNPDQIDSDNDGIGDACNNSSTEEIKFSIYVYPNPAKDKLNIEINNVNEYHIEIHDFSGKNIYNTESKKSNKIIDLDKFSDGIYTIKIFSKEINYISKLIINN